jgi:hypothetical protein
MIEFKGSHFERDVILQGIRWYVAYPTQLSRFTVGRFTGALLNPPPARMYWAERTPIR